VFVRLIIPTFPLGILEQMAYLNLRGHWHLLATWLVAPTMLLRSRASVKRQKRPLWCSCSSGIRWHETAISRPNWLPDVVPYNTTRLEEHA
jgi:hypothetical protein